MGSSLLDILLTQSRAALLALSDASIAKREREREVDDLLGAAQLVGESALEEQMQALSATLLQGPQCGLPELAAFIDSLQVQLSPPGQPDESDYRQRAPIPRKPPQADVAEASAVSPRSHDSSFDTGEHLALLNIFRDEAGQGLQRISGILLETGTQKPSDDPLHEIMRLTHGLKGAAGTVDLPGVANITHEFEGIFERIREGSLPWSMTMRSRLTDIADSLHIAIASARSPESVDRSAAAIRDKLEAVITDRKQVDTNDEIDTGQVASLVVTEGTSSDSYAERRRPDRRGADSPMLRVDSGRIDSLMDCVGELVFDRTRIEKRVKSLSSELLLLREALENIDHLRSSDEQDEQDLSTSLGVAFSKLEAKLRESLPKLEHELGKLGEDASRLRKTEFALQEGLTSVRMQSISSFFARLTPQLRVIARGEKKQVRLVTAGGDTEFDKAVADKLVDPVIQLLRNSVAHGIESPAERSALGKPPEGRIMVTARHEGNVIVLEVSDDGAGIGVDTLRERLVQKELLSESQALHASDDRILQKIFDAGVSSRVTTNQLAGRGVGLSSVREAVTRLGGEVRVSSQMGSGTRFTLRLPLTTLVARATLFKLGGHVFALPSVHVVEQKNDATSVLGAKSVLDDAGQTVPLVPLHEIMGYCVAEGAPNCPVIHLSFMGRRLALSCDRVIGTREIIVKSLGPMLAGLPLYSGGTISPSGKVQLILDAATLASIAYPGKGLGVNRLVGATERTNREKQKGSGGERVLVVDDSRAIREAMRRMLTNAGYSVETASNGADAWSRICQQHFSIVLSDLEMPGEGGFALLSRLGLLIRDQALRVLVISSKDTVANRQRAAKLGAVDFLAKPVSRSQLIAAVQGVQQ